MPRAQRPEVAQEQGGESGDPRELEMMTGNGGPSGVRQPLPPLHRSETRQAFVTERRAALDAIPPPKRYRVTKVPRNTDGGVMNVVGKDGRSFRLNEGKELDERYFDIPGIKRQGVKLELIDAAKEAQAELDA